MEPFFIGFYLGSSLIVALGPQNLFVIEQGLKRNHTFLVCLICSLSDLIFIIIGTTLFQFFSQKNHYVDLILSLLLFVFIINFIINKIKSSPNPGSLSKSNNFEPAKNVILKTLAFTYLNPHVYSDTIFIIGGFSTEFDGNTKKLFVIGATLASFVYFLFLGYASSYLANFISNEKSWKFINLLVIFTMLLLSIFVIYKIVATLFLII